MNVPPQPGFNLLADAIGSDTVALLRAGRHSPILQYQPSIGNVLDRVQAARTLEGRGIPAQPDQIAITAGAQHALHGIVAALLSSGDRVCCAPVIYSGMLALAKRKRLELVPVASDDEGMLPDSLAAGLQSGVRTVYLTPTNDNPTTATMGATRRAEIVSAVRRYGAVLIEDDAYGPLALAPPAPCAALAPECCWHIAGTSKLISPVIRVAHVRAPSPGDAAKLAGHISETAVMAPPLNAALVTLWQRSGRFDELVAGVRAESVARQRLVAKHLSAFSYRAHPEGYHIWLDTGGLMEPVTLAARVTPFGLSAVPASAFDVSGELSGQTRLSKIRISVGGAIDHDSLERALVLLGELLLNPSS